jgi:hypothetical protein
MLLQDISALYNNHLGPTSVAISQKLQRAGTKVRMKVVWG